MGGGVTIHVHTVVNCEHDGCHRRIITGPRPVSQVSDATLEARMRAQEYGWRTRRGHSGVDLCAEHRGMA